MKKKSIEEDIRIFIEKKIVRPGCNCETLVSSLVDKKGLDKNTAETLAGLIKDRLNKKDFPRLSQIEMMVTEGCNLNCRYCFVSNKNTHGRMASETAFKAIDFLLENSGRRKKLYVFFIGGEPLLEFNLIKATVDYAREKTQNADKKIAFRLTTNGTLFTREILSYMKENNVDFMLSLDGGPDTQNMFRKYASGKGSYEEIENKIPLIKEYFSSFPVRMTPMPETVPMLFENFRHLVLELGLQNFLIAYASGVEWNKSQLEMFKEQMEKIIYWIREMTVSRREIKILNLESEHEQNNKENNLGCIAGNESVIVTKDGSLYPCCACFGLNVSEKIFRLGSIDEGFTDLYNRMILSGMIIIRQPKCEGCPDKDGCTGGCYAINYQETGDFFTPSSYHCNFIKISNFLSKKAESVLGREYFRMLKKSREYHI